MPKNEFTSGDDDKLGAQKDQDMVWPHPNPESLAMHFSRLGWIGFWIQLVLVAVPILLLVYIIVLGRPESSRHQGGDLINYLSYGSLLLMMFTTFWFFRYTGLAKRIVVSDLCPPRALVLKTLWIGLLASCLSICISMILMMSSVGRILYVLMSTPQTGLPIAAAGGDPTMTMSAIDAASLTSLLLILSAELIIMAFSLWLLFRVTVPSAKTVSTVSAFQE